MLAARDGKAFSPHIVRAVVSEATAANRLSELTEWVELAEKLFGKSEEEILPIIKRERANLQTLHASFVEERLVDALEIGYPIFAEGGMARFVEDDTFAHAEVDRVVDKMRGAP
jgi:hypothetical protein